MASLQRLLITQAHLVRFQGSEMVTLELATHFSRRGWDVVVATHSFGGDLVEPFAQLSGVRVFELPDPALAELLSAWTPDVAWIHHGIIPEPVLRAAADVTFVFHHMSSYLPIEFSVSGQLEGRLAAVSTFISEEVKEAQLASGLFATVDPARMQLVENPAPDEFVADRTGASDGRMLVVSNHLPEEFVEALPRLREHYDIELVGAQAELGATPRRVDSELVASADVVVSIGKTIQYAIASGAAPYVYDHFGGPGWLDADSFDLAAHSHFSGRGFERKTADDIVADLVVRRPAAEETWHALAAEVRDRFVLGPRIDALLAWASRNPREVAPLSELDIRQHLAMQDAFGQYVREWIRMWGDARWERERAAAADARIGYLESRLVTLEADRISLASLPGYSFARRLFRSRLRDRRNEIAHGQ